MNELPINVEQLLAYAAGDLDAAASAKVEAQLASNAEAAKLVQLYRTTHQIARADDTVAPPATTIAAARSLMAEALARRVHRGWFESLRQLVGELVFDSRPKLAMAGLRGASESYQLSYETGDTNIDLEVERYVDHGQVRFRVTGQVTQTAAAHVGAVAIAAPGTFEPVAVTQADQRGVFTLTTTGGTFDVLIEVQGEQVIVLPSIQAN